STLGTTSLEDLALGRESTRLWFQLYVNRDRRLAEELMHRARAAGYEALVLTVDAAVGGIRRREVRDGLTIPPQLSLRTLADMAAHPRWWMNAVTTEPLEFANLSSTAGTVGDLLSRVFDPSLSAADLAWIREHWSGPLVIKGIQNVEDARMVADLGVDAVVLSNHGGRQIDMGRAPLELLPSVVAAVGERVEIYIDGGVMSGSDVVASLAFGARGALVGRAYLYGLMAAGAPGVRRVAEILAKEVSTTMQLLGVSSVGQLRHAEVRLRSAE
ncbi:MAG: alpha-hydroxy acid oxidase, partial [bacterium]|nr:alpha-hydroxy acid oxidase [bacterium]